MYLKISTWNVNSVRKRIKHTLRFLKQASPDILCLQETKVTDELFPHNPFNEVGYKYIITNGQKSYNGVAIISRVPLEEIKKETWKHTTNARHLQVRLPRNIELHNFYLAAGGQEPDPNINSKFKEKLNSYKELTKFFITKDLGKKRILVGDLNIAPKEEDVWSHERLKNVVSHTPIEIECYYKLFNSIDWVDAVREIRGTKSKLYTWWSYRSINWKKENKGRRLDHIWVSEILKDKIKNIKISSNTRSWKEPSDHVPITIDLIV